MRPPTPCTSRPWTPGLLVAAASSGPAHIARHTKRRGTFPQRSRRDGLWPNPDGPGTLVRPWEQAGQGGDCSVQLPAGRHVSSVQPVDLRGRPRGAPMPSTTTRLRFLIGVQAESIRQLFDWIMMALGGAAFAVPNVLRWYWWAHSMVGATPAEPRGPAGGTARAVRSKHGRLADSRVSRDE